MSLAIKHFLLVHVLIASTLTFSPPLSHHRQKLAIIFEQLTFEGGLQWFRAGGQRLPRIYGYNNRRYTPVHRVSDSFDSFSARSLEAVLARGAMDFPSRSRERAPFSRPVRPLSESVSHLVRPWSQGLTSAELRRAAQQCPGLM